MNTLELAGYGPVIPVIVLQRLADAVPMARALVAGGVLVAGPASQIGWLLLSGPLTALPLLWFAGAARRPKLSTLGLVQYLGPTLQLMLAVWVFHEPFDTMRLVGFVMIWSALALVSADALGWRPGAGRTGAV